MTFWLLEGDNSMENKKTNDKVIKFSKGQSDDRENKSDGTGIVLTREQIEFFRLCREFNNDFYEGSIKTVVIPYESGDVKYIGGIKGPYAHGKGKLYKSDNVPYKEGYFRNGLYLGPEDTQCTRVFMEDIIEDICKYLPSMDKSLLRNASEGIAEVQDVEDYMSKNDISSQVEKIIYGTIIVD